MIFFVWLALFRSHEWIQTPLPREREETSPLSCGPKCTIDGPRDKKKKIGFNCRPEESFLLDITKKGKKSVCAPCGTYIFLLRRKSVTTREYSFSSASHSLSLSSSVMCAARVWCASGFFLREALKMWVLLIILTTRVRVFFGLYRLRFLCLDLLVLTLRFGLSSVPA